MKIRNIKNRRKPKHITERIFALSFVMLAVTLIMALFNFDHFSKQVLKEDIGWVLIIFSLQGLLTSVLGRLILTRHPGHGVGRIFGAIGFLFSWFTISYAANIIFGPKVADLPAIIRIFYFVGSGVYLLPLMLSMGVVPLIFPDGQLPSPRWRPALILLIIGIVGTALLQALVDLQEEFPIISEALSETAWIGGISTSILILGFIASLASLIFRFIHARGEERTRMKWLVYTAVVSISLSLIMSLILGEDSAILAVFSVFIPSYLTISIGIAILRHQLFDIDIIIRRTLQYFILTAFLGTVYFGGVVLLQNVFDALVGNHKSPLITVFTTLAIAALFNPLRIRIQDFIDQRFYRAKYDADKALADFAVTARNEMDLKVISTRILSVVTETLQPEDVNLLLKLPETRK